MKKYKIWCWSAMKNDYAPSVWPSITGIEEARKFADTNIKHGTDFEIRAA